MRWLYAVMTAVLATGCGGTAGHARGAEPASSPPPRVSPAGRIIRVGALAEGIAVDPGSHIIAVATRTPDQIVALSATSGRLLWRVGLPGHARHLTLAGAGGPLLIPVETANQLLELDLTSRRVVASTAVGRLPHDATADSGRLFVTDEFGRRVTVVEHGRIVGQVTGFVQPGGIIATGDDVAVVDVGADTLTLINASTLRRIAVVNAGAGPTHVVADAAGDIYVIDTRGDAVEEFGTLPRLRRLRRVPLAGTPYGVAADPAHARLWVTLTATDELAELDIGDRRPRLVARYPTGRQPNTVAVDTSTGAVVVANAAGGTVEIIRPSR